MTKCFVLERKQDWYENISALYRFSFMCWDGWTLTQPTNQAGKLQCNSTQSKAVCSQTQEVRPQEKQTENLNEGNNPGSERLNQTDRKRLCLKSLNIQGGRCRGRYNELIGEMKKHIQMLHRSFSPWLWDECNAWWLYPVHPTYQDALWAIMSPLRRTLIHIIDSDNSTTNSRLIQPEI